MATPGPTPPPAPPPLLRWLARQGEAGPGTVDLAAWWAARPAPAADLARLARALRVAPWDGAPPPTAEALGCVAAGLPGRLRLLPVALTAEGLLAATADPLEAAALDALARAAGRPVVPLLTAPAVLAAALARHDRAAPPAPPRPTAPASPGPATAADLPGEAAAWLEEALRAAVAAGASDVHLEPLEGRLRVRWRVDGLLRPAPPPPRAGEAAVVARAKLLAGMDLAERRRPQDGRLSLSARPGAPAAEFRAACLPGLFGEAVVLRRLGLARPGARLAELGYPDEMADAIAQTVSGPPGAVLIGGPTGAGKTTTLYALLATLAQADRKLVTVEDPPEAVLAGAVQAPVDPAAGLTFAGALRAALRQAPDALLVGEMRDPESAGTALQAALTGHLVLSSVHAPEAPAIPLRLLDLGAPAWLVAAALRGLAAQRLVRRRCPACAAGCPACGGTGYCGRTALPEWWAPAPGQLEDAAAGLERLRARARAAGWQPLRTVGEALVRAGQTTAAELDRVCGPGR